MQVDVARERRDFLHSFSRQTCGRSDGFDKKLGRSDETDRGSRLSQ
jgi:hypothetical protein